MCSTNRQPKRQSQRSATTGQTEVAILASKTRDTWYECISSFPGFMFSVDIKASAFKKRLERAQCEHLKHINQAGKAEGRTCVPL